MTNQPLAIIGDVHGELKALQSILQIIEAMGIRRTVLLGDYINKGKNSAAVIDLLCRITRTENVTALRGNHEREFLAALKTGDMTSFLKMGGAMTAKSYLKRPANPSVWSDLAQAVPEAHVKLLDQMAEQYEEDSLVAHHEPHNGVPKKYTVSAHRVVGKQPVIGDWSAQIDTGCGDPSGRLTALIWPSLTYIQTDHMGNQV